MSESESTIPEDDKLFEALLSVETQDQELKRAQKNSPRDEKTAPEAEGGGWMKTITGFLGKVQTQFVESGGEGKYENLNLDCNDSGLNHFVNEEAEADAVARTITGYTDQLPDWAQTAANFTGSESFELPLIGKWNVEDGPKLSLKARVVSAVFAEFSTNPLIFSFLLAFIALHFAGFSLLATEILSFLLTILCGIPSICRLLGGKFEAAYVGMSSNIDKFLSTPFPVYNSHLIFLPLTYSIFIPAWSMDLSPCIRVKKMLLDKELSSIHVQSSLTRKLPIFCLLGALNFQGAYGYGDLGSDFWLFIPMALTRVFLGEDIRILCLARVLANLLMFTGILAPWEAFAFLFGWMCFSRMVEEGCVARQKLPLFIDTQITFFFAASWMQFYAAPVVSIQGTVLFLLIYGFGWNLYWGILLHAEKDVTWSWNKWTPQEIFNLLFVFVSMSHPLLACLHLLWAFYRILYPKIIEVYFPAE